VNRGDDADPAPPAATRARLLGRIPPLGRVPLVAVTAPAGFGKSTLIAQWAAASASGPLAWIELSARDDEASLARRIVRGLTSGAQPGGEPSLTDVVNLAADLDTPLAIVLDDLHLATSATQTAVRALIRQAPGSVTVAIGSRQSLRFPIGRLLAHGEAVLLDASDLAFTLDETSMAFEAVTGDATDDDVVNALHDATGGWPLAAVRLAPLVRATGLASPAAVTAFDEMDETVLAGLPADAAALAVDTAHLDPLEPTLAAAVTDRPDAGRVLHDLACRHQLAIETESAYRRHPGIEQLLRRRFDRRDAGSRTRLQRRAADWYRTHGAPLRALNHAAATGDPDVAHGLITPAIGSALTGGHGALLRQWAAALPLPPDLAPRDRALVAMATAFLPSRAREHWGSPLGEQPLHPAVRAAVEGAEHARAGRCRDALEDVRRARAHLDLDPPGGTVAPVAEALLDVVETDCRFLTRPSGSDVEHADPLPASPWPWLSLRSLGVRALDAYVGGRPAVARALLDHAERHRDGIEPSWTLLGGGALALTQALVASDAAGTPDERQEATDATAAVLDRTECMGDVPLAMLARYGLSRASVRSGDTRTAFEVRARADAALRWCPDLTFVHEARHALTGPGRPALTEGVIERLTAAERAVVGRFASALTLGEIADELHLSPHTVKTHARSIYRKLGVTSRPQVVRLLKDV
jgi:LuxR family maltose regulon positive regulatory protein